MKTYQSIFDVLFYEFEESMRAMSDRFDSGDVNYNEWFKDRVHKLCEEYFKEKIFLSYH